MIFKYYLIGQFEALYIYPKSLFIETPNEVAVVSTSKKHSWSDPPTIVTSFPFNFMNRSYNFLGQWYQTCLFAI